MKKCELLIGELARVVITSSLFAIRANMISPAIMFFSTVVSF